MKIGKVGCFLKVKPTAQNHPHQKMKERAAAWMMVVAAQIRAALTSSLLPVATSLTHSEETAISWTSLGLFALGSTGKATAV